MSISVFRASCGEAEYSCAGTPFLRAIPQRNEKELPNSLRPDTLFVAYSQAVTTREIGLASLLHYLAYAVL
jgi:hypothetical protein